MLRNLEPFVNAIEDTFCYSHSPVTARSLPGRRLDHHDAWFVLKESPDGLYVQIPEFGHFRWRMMALGRTR